MFAHSLSMITGYFEQNIQEWHELSNKAFNYLFNKLLTIHKRLKLIIIFVTYYSSNFYE